MTINHNVKIEIERVNGSFLAQVEIAGVGKCSRTRTTYPTMDECLAGVAGHYAQGYAALEAYGRPAPAPEPAPFKVELLPQDTEPSEILEALAPPEAKIDRRTKEGKRRFAAAPTP